MTQTSAWNTARNILCIRLDHIGDVLMATPALRALKESFAGCRLTLLAAPAGAIVSRHIPEVDDTIEYAAPWMKSSTPHDVADDIDMITLLRERRFDAAIIFTTYSQSPLPAAMLCMLAGIPLRLAHCRENPYQLLTDWIPDPEPRQAIRHEVRRQLDLVAAVGAQTGNERLSFALHPDDLIWASAQLEARDIDRSQPWILLHPGSTAQSRRYPAEHWAHAAAELSRRLSCNLVFSGSVGEAALVAGIIEHVRSLRPGARAHNFAGKATLGQLAAIMSQASLLITNNTGPAHLAAALGKPVVDLYALTNPQHTPWKTPNRVLYQDVPCRFCYKSVCPQGHHRCLSDVEPARVVNAALELLRDDPMTLPQDMQDSPPLAQSLPA
ncbi:lipopolysaccharide heptosyltransferase II [Paucimonas lemoignei]|uniref:lipopolysaccharide heptosyltransferase II n=1 Tax=Paucimonas lemoignei TaxID=29443 RepID=A0A4R3HQX7_PAULE|nr:lipopolysaccharide heptosyltransferase II [Paucimonas lemoignei]TCS34679.1 lipopolysaccharide heptosyltransferase II [Paucimonas lemoignei]